MKPTTKLKSIICCPFCNHKKEETMPTATCQFFYECQNCKKILRPLATHCCVFCSYGDVPCPSIQEKTNGCK